VSRAFYLDLSAAVHRRAGLGRYAESLARAMTALAPDEVAFFFNRESGVEPLSGLEAQPTRTVALGYKPWRMIVLAAQGAGLGFDRFFPDARLFHATEHLLLPFHHLPTVLTVHDLIFRHLPQHHKRLNRWYLNLAMPLYVRRATHLIAVSEATRRDLMAAYGVPAEKITVIYEAADPRFGPRDALEQQTIRANYGLPPAYFLYLGTIEPRKNLLRLLRAWEPLYLAGEAPPLVIVGKRGWLSEPFFEAVKRSPARKGLILTGYVLDDDLPALIAAATAFVFPSLYEGFGLPPLEAMACGTPVVASTASSVPEVVGEAGLLVEPEDVAGWTAAMGRLLEDAPLRQRLREAGLRRAATFTWEAAGRRWLDLVLGKEASCASD
jgi:glycosyltransferase involved in cell wall biosynthesis